MKGTSGPIEALNGVCDSTIVILGASSRCQVFIIAAKLTDFDTPCSSGGSGANSLVANSEVQGIARFRGIKIS